MSDPHTRQALLIQAVKLDWRIKRLKELLPMGALVAPTLYNLTRRELKLIKICKSLEEEAATLRKEARSLTPAKP